ncbi:TonB-dependent receptor [Stenotrophomonas sp. YAU14D1_LEIMI4_1]|uniref:TonB-dependent receptor domain-containing protein n=1 Tax=Stenotrophomonas sp. YAU14D1_LEIMI4_1 TaxID=2072407 RepID=UPI000D53EB91|nr:TonB-dependent receptor [Stenotrophomonas sp. YAU14D1_LEIMI4_1]AWH26791.1 TonB-dependent receptor [Stenotrophomonas sp. YAU14D1_LEIMI4_1]
MSHASPNRRRSITTLTAAIGLALAAHAHADASADASSARQLDTVVVTATGAQQWIKDAPASISVITREEIERKPVSSIGQLLSTVPGVTGGYALSGAQSKIRLRGLPEQYTLILIDGRRQGSSAGVNYRDDLGPQDLNWLSPDMIERIEVVRGPMSSLYGSDAMGGVINIITRKIADHWGGSATFNYSKPDSDTRGNTTQMGALFSGPLTQNLGVRVGANVTDRESDRGARQTPGNKAENANVQFHWRVNDNHSVGVEASRGTQRNSGAGAVSSWGLSKLVQTGYVLSHDGKYGDASTSKTTLVQNDYEDKGSTVGNHSKETVFDTAFTTGFHWGFEHSLNLGGQWKREELENSDTIGTVPVTWTGSGRISPTSEADSWALFAEDHITLHERFVLTLGLRWDNTENYDDNLSPRIYGVWHPADAWTVRGGISKGFRAPNLKQGTAGAATQSGGNGCRALTVEGWSSTSVNADGTRGCYMAGNPNLEPETSTNYELGLGYDQGGWSASATYFLTNFDDKIEQVPLSQIPGQTTSFVNGYWWTVAQNIQKARTRGVEASVTVPLHERLSWTTNATRMLESKNRTTGATLLVVPELTANTSLEWQVTDAWSLNASAQHIGKQLVSATSATFAKAYTTWDLVTGFDVNENLTLRAGVLNVGDVSTIDEGNNYDGGARTFFVGATARF